MIRGVDCAHSLRKITDIGEFISWKTSVPRGRIEKKVSLVFYREVDVHTDKYVIFCKKRKYLTLLQRVKLFLGHGDFSLENVCQTVNEVFSTSLKEDTFRQCNKRQISWILHGVRFLEETVREHSKRKQSVIPSEGYSQIGLKYIYSLLDKIQFFKFFAPFVGDSKPFDLGPINQTIESLQNALKLKEESDVTKPSDSGLQISDLDGCGMENPGALCYCNSTIKALWASFELRKSIWEDPHNETGQAIDALQKLKIEMGQIHPNFDDATIRESICIIGRFSVEIEQAFNRKDTQQLLRDIPHFIKKIECQKVVRESIQNVFSQIDTKKQGTIRYSKEPLKNLVNALRVLFPLLEKKKEQQDESELLYVILEAILPPEQRANIRLYLHIERNGQAEQVELREKVCKKDQGTALDMLVAAVTIPSLKGRELGRQSAVLIRAPEKTHALHLENFFSDVREEYVDVHSFISPEHNPWLMEAHRASLLKAADARGYLPSVFISETNELMGEPPPFLPVYVARFLDRYHKNLNPVIAPFKLSVPLFRRECAASYQLRSIVVHEGGCFLNGGHYVTYVPVYSSPRGVDGRPTVWQVHCDTLVYTVTWEVIAKKVDRNATLYMYDKL